MLLALENNGAHINNIFLYVNMWFFCYDYMFSVGIMFSIVEVVEGKSIKGV